MDGNMSPNPTFKSQMPWTTDPQAGKQLSKQHVVRPAQHSPLAQAQCQSPKDTKPRRRSPMLPQDSGKGVASPSVVGGGRSIHPSSQGLWHDLPTYAPAVGPAASVPREGVIEATQQDLVRHKSPCASESRDRYLNQMNSPLAEAPARKNDRSDTDSWARKLAEMRHGNDDSGFRESKMNDVKAKSDLLQLRSPVQSQARKVLSSSDFANSPLAEEETELSHKQQLLTVDNDRNSSCQMSSVMSASSVLRLLSPAASMRNVAGPSPIAYSSSRQPTSAELSSVSNLRADAVIEASNDDTDLIGDMAIGGTACRPHDNVDVLAAAQRQLEEWLSFKAKYGNDICQLLDENSRNDDVADGNHDCVAVAMAGTMNHIGSLKSLCEDRICTGVLKHGGYVTKTYTLPSSKVISAKA